MKVMVECYHDAALVRSLGIPIRRLGHEHGKWNVLGRMAKWDGPVVGVVDADPGKQGGNNRELAKYHEDQSAHGLMRMKYETDDRKVLVVASPALEEWLLARSEAASLRVQDYGLPESARAMHRSPRYDLKPGFLRLLADLARDPGMQTLKKWLSA